jgi:hypothetical protein
MKKIVIATFFAAFVLLSSCKPTSFGGSNAFYGQVNQTQVVLNSANFKVLGSFVGTSSSKTSLLSVKDKEGLVTAAKQDFLNNAKAAGVTLTGSRAIVNTRVDYMNNDNRITVTFSGEIIEFTK